MFLRIDPNRPLPIFAQIVEGVRLAVATERIQPGDRIPSIRDLAVELRVNPNTVAKAYKELERARLVQVQRGMGYFIAEEADGQLGSRERRGLLQARVDELITEALELGFGPEDIKKTIDQKTK